MSRNDFVQDWVPLQRDERARELALRYHAECEAYDRTVCTGPVIDGAIQPFGARQAGLIAQNASRVFGRIRFDAARDGIDEKELWRAIGRAS